MGYYTARPEAVEQQNTSVSKKIESVTVSTLDTDIKNGGNPVHGVVFSCDELEPNTQGGFPLSDVIMGLVNLLQRENVAHNMFFCDGGKRVFLWPRRHQEIHSDASALNCAVMELAGHLIIPSKEALALVSNISEIQLKTLLSKSRLSEGRFDKLLRSWLSLYER